RLPGRVRDRDPRAAGAVGADALQHLPAVAASVTAVAAAAIAASVVAAAAVAAGVDAAGVVAGAVVAAAVVQLERVVSAAAAGQRAGDQRGDVVAAARGPERQHGHGQRGETPACHPDTEHPAITAVNSILCRAKLSAAA